jgi:hypothetical protein
MTVWEVCWMTIMKRNSYRFDWSECEAGRIPESSESPELQIFQRACMQKDTIVLPTGYSKLGAIFGQLMCQTFRMGNLRRCSFHEKVLKVWKNGRRQI